MPEKTERNSSIEILRIIAMILIVLSHYSSHGGFELDTIKFGVNRYLLQAVKLGDLGVDIFILISGYFLINSVYHFKKVLQLILQVLFYSIGFFVLFILLGIEPFALKTFVKSFLPVIFKSYWFITAYIVLYILSPYFNHFLHSISKITYLKFLGTILILWSVIPSLLYGNMYGNQIAQFLMFYSIGAFIRMYPENILSKKSLGPILAIVCAGLMFLSVLAMNLVGLYIPIFAEKASYFFMRPSILTIGLAVGLLLIFLNLNIRQSRFINTVASCTFGVYLIHENIFVRPFLWKKVLKNFTYVDSPYLFLHMIISVICVYIICTVIEYLRKKRIEKKLTELLDNHYQQWAESLHSLIKQLGSYFNKIGSKIT